MKKTIIALLVCFMLFGSITVFANQNVSVRIAPFYTEINYESIDNRYVEYPLIVYKDITYLPMTYDLCQSLNLVTGYTAEDGLYITSQYTENNNLSEKKPYGGYAVNNIGQEYSASVAQYPVFLNGVRIYNEKEVYPLLNFRNITYFPMTWRFANDEMGLEINWMSEENALILCTKNTGSVLYPTQNISDKVEFIEYIDVYEPQYGELHSYNKSYIFDITNKMITNKEFTPETSTEGRMYNVETPTKTSEMKTEIKGNAVYADGLLLKQFSPEDNVTSCAAYSTDIGNNTSIVRLNNQSGDAPAPYTQTANYLFEIKDNKVRELPFDMLYNADGVYDMGDKVYISADGYRPQGASRWSNSFSDLFIYNKADGSITSMADMNKDTFNSIRFLGYTEGKIYVNAMWFNGDKTKAGVDGMPTFNAVKSGFYCVDTQNNAMTKLYPYIRGEYFVFNDGNLYAVADYGARPRLVNLCTGDIYKFE